MKSELVRFGVAMEAPLLVQLDALVDARGGTRSEILRDLVRAEVARSKVSSGVDAVAALTLVYDHHVRELSEKLTDVQHELGERVNSTLHVHLDDAHCLEVIILKGRSDELQRIAERLLATRGVKHGGIEIITDIRKADAGEVHDHGHGPHRHAKRASKHSHVAQERHTGARLKKRVTS